MCHGGATLRTHALMIENRSANDSIFRRSAFSENSRISCAEDDERVSERAKWAVCAPMSRTCATGHIERQCKTSTHAERKQSS